MSPAAPPERARRERPRRAFDLENSIGYLLNRAAHIIAARFSDELLPHGVNLQTWRLLAALSHRDCQSLTDLADHTGAELSYLSRAVGAAADRGLVERLPSPGDRRSVLLSLSPQGRALVARLAPRGEAIQQEALAGVPVADCEVTRRTLQAIYTNLVSSSEGLQAVNRKLMVAQRVRRRRPGLG